MTLEETIADRLKKLSDFYGLNSIAAFARHTGLQHQTASNYLKGKQKPDAEMLASIIQSFDKIDARWLLTGEGEMLGRESAPLEESEFNTLYRVLTHIVVELGELKKDVSKIKVKDD